MRLLEISSNRILLSLQQDLLEVFTTDLDIKLKGSELNVDLPGNAKLKVTVNARSTSVGGVFSTARAVLTLNDEGVSQQYKFTERQTLISIVIREPGCFCKGDSLELSGSWEEATRFFTHEVRGVLDGYGYPNS